MKLTVILLFAVLLQLKAEVYSQQISLSQKNASVEDVFMQIMGQTTYDFVYPSEVLQGAGPMDIELQNASLAEALDKCFEGQPLTYVIDNAANTVIVRVALSTITGKVTTTDGGPLPGVTVLIKGTTKGVSTDADGRFSIEAKKNDILVFSYIGYKTQEITLRGETEINLVMEPEVSVLNELVVVGYGSAARKDLTGSVSSVRADEVKLLPSKTIDDALNGKAAGVMVTKSDGSPGGGVRMRIRGGTSLTGGNDPLYIVDGIQITPQNRYIQSPVEYLSPADLTGSGAGNGAVSEAFARGLNNLAGLNINDIESIDILKDASATAIYGSKAANGVVIITTKKGKQNTKPSLEANYYTSYAAPINEKRLNRDEYIMIMKEGAKNLNDALALLGLPSDPAADQILNNPDYYGTANTDWLDLVTRTGITQNADINVRGGGNGSSYYTSLSYSEQTGVLKGTDFSRIAGKVNLENDISKRIKLITNLDYGFTKNNITNGIYSNAQLAPPTFEAYNPDGSVNLFNTSSLGMYTRLQNPLALLKGINQAKVTSLLGSIALEYEIVPTLVFRSAASVNYNNYNQVNYAPSITQLSQSTLAGGVGSQGHSEITDWFYENTLTWNKSFNSDNRINIVAGTTWQQSKSNTFSAAGQGFPDDEYLNGLSSAAIALMPSAIYQQNSLLSFYLRSFYAYKDRYMVTFTGRSDASSKFPASNRVGYFPSLGLAWRLSEENFMKGISWLNEFKVRASAGYTGTQNIGNNMFYTLYSPVSYAGQSALVPSQLGNDEIKWESTLQKDLGVDFSLFNYRLNGAVGYYKKSTSGILLASSVPPNSGFSSVLRNMADIENKGWEVDLRADIVKAKDFQWSTSFNVSANRSKVLNINRDIDNASSAALSDDPFLNSLYMGNSIVREGEPIGALYGYKFDGLIRTQEELEAYKAECLFIQFGYFPYLNIGDARYELVEEGEYKGWFKPTIIGHAEPDFFGGLTNTFSYKGFSLTALCTFSYGGDLLYTADMHNLSLWDQTNKGVRILDRYTPENTDTDRPRLILGQFSAPFNSNPSSAIVYDASFFKLKSLTISWQVPGKFVNKLHVSNASLYCSATNLLTITDYPGADPEISSDPYSLIGGYSDPGTYPTVKQYSFGIRFNF